MIYALTDKQRAMIEYALQVANLEVDPSPCAEHAPTAVEGCVNCTIPPYTSDDEDDFMRLAERIGDDGSADLDEIDMDAIYSVLGGEPVPGLAKRLGEGAQSRVFNRVHPLFAGGVWDPPEVLRERLEAELAAIAACDPESR